jgi:GNAT superfamily N-acetyltransferase
VLHQPNGYNTKIKRVSRLVILPDYQGIGLGTKFLNNVAQYYYNLGFDFEIITSAKNLIHSLNNKNNWSLHRLSQVKMNKSYKCKIDFNRQTRQCKTASFFYKGD